MAARKRKPVKQSKSRYAWDVKELIDAMHKLGINWATLDMDEHGEVFINTGLVTGMNERGQAFLVRPPHLMEEK